MRVVHQPISFILDCSLPSFGYDCPVMGGIQSGECIKVEDSYLGRLVSIVAYGCVIAATYKSLDEVMKIAKSCQYNMGR